MQVMAFQALLFSKDAQNSRLAGEVRMTSDFTLAKIIRLLILIKIDDNRFYD